MRAEREIEGGTASGLRFGTNRAAVAMDDALHGGETDAGAFEIFLAMQPLKGPEELIGIFRIEAHSVVAHEEGDGARGCGERAELNHPMRQAAGEFDGVGDEVGIDDFEKTGIATDVGQWVDAPLDGAAIVAVAVVGNRTLDQFVDGNAAAVEFFAANAG